MRPIILSTAALTAALITACSFFQAAPSECIQAAESAGLPDSVIEQLRDPDGLDPIQQAALQQILRRAGIDDVCDFANERGKQQQQTGAQQQPQPQADDEPDNTSSDRATAEPQAGNSDTTDQKLHEQMRWCKAWALDNLKPLIYSEFVELDPRTMDDIDRTIWRDRLREQCAELYGSEQVAAGNADKRNEQFRLECLTNLASKANYQWESLAEAAYERDNPTAHEIPNQYVRIMRWMHLSGEELLGLEEPPHEFLERLSEYDYASEANWYVNIPDAQSVMNAQDKHGDNFSIDWWGLHYAATNRSYGIEGCSEYFPQFFYGRWIPHAEPPIETPTPDPEQQRALDDFNAEIQRILESSLYLPRP